MPADNEIEQLYIDLLDRMTLAGWLKSYARAQGKGYHLIWTEDGNLKINFIKTVAERSNLCFNDRMPFVFDTVAHGDPLPSYAEPFDIDPDIAKAWRECSTQLNIRGNPDLLHLLAQVALKLAPDQDTRTVSP
ncbi:hypothetical protein MLD52_20515 [Puniceicoccaceae bacterium K14]|nr:hypothetical protein [Puniceicoccaceae bacterium K14]